MCLLVKSKSGKLKFKTAAEDIVCYKMIHRVCRGKKHRFCTPYQGCDISEDCISGNDVFEARGGEMLLGDSSTPYIEIYGGFIHTYKNDYDAADHMFSFQHEIWKCDSKGNKIHRGNIWV